MERTKIPRGKIRLPGKVTEPQLAVLDAMVAALKQAGLKATRSAVCRMALGPYLQEPETAPNKLRGRGVMLGPLSEAEAIPLFNDYFEAASRALVETREADVAIIAAASRTFYVFVCMSNEYLLRCLLTDLEVAAVAAEKATRRDKPTVTVTAVVNAREHAAVKARAVPLGLKRAPVGHSRCVGHLLGHFLDGFPAYLLELEEQRVNRTPAERPRNH